MSDIDLEALRRQARRQTSETRRGGGDSAPSFEIFDLDDLEEYGWLILAITACIGLSIYLGSFAPILYLGGIIAAGMALALVWMVIEPIFEFIMDHLEDIKDGIIVLPALLLGIGIFVSSLSEGKNIVEAVVIAVISFIMLSGLIQLAFWLLELAVEHWGWALVIGVFVVRAVLN